MGRDKNKRSQNHQTVPRDETKKNENTTTVFEPVVVVEPIVVVTEPITGDGVEETLNADSILDSIKIGPDTGNLIDIPLHAPPTIPESVFLPLQHFSTPRERTVISSVLEKALVNLGVLSDMRIGDKLDRTPNGNFVIQKPCWYTTISRQVKGVNRQQTLELVSDLIGGTENSIRDGYNDPRIRKALIHSIHGLRNMQTTYEGDSLFRATIEVLLQRIKMRYNLDGTQML
jgi:hypothetical protein